jgi:hypothetical protein
VLEQRMRVAPSEPAGWSLTRSEATVTVDGDRVEVRRPGRSTVSFSAPA